MPADTPRPDERPDPRDGTAVIPPVTDAMMDHAAQEAAALADGVARHAVELPHSAETPAAEAPTDIAPPPAERAAGAAQDAAGDTLAKGEALAEAAANRAPQGAAEAARDGLSVPADALSQYNAKVFEMVRANMASTTALFAALVQARSVPEALSINADHMRRQAETLASQGRELAGLAQAVALGALQPFKTRGER